MLAIHTQVVTHYAAADICVNNCSCGPVINTYIFINITKPINYTYYNNCVPYTETLAPGDSSNTNITGFWADAYSFVSINGTPTFQVIPSNMSHHLNSNGAVVFSEDLITVASNASPIYYGHAIPLIPMVWGSLNSTAVNVRTGESPWFFQAYFPPSKYVVTNVIDNNLHQPIKYTYNRTTGIVSYIGGNSTTILYEPSSGPSPPCPPSQNPSPPQAIPPSPSGSPSQSNISGVNAPIRALANQITTNPAFDLGILLIIFLISIASYLARSDDPRRRFRKLKKKEAYYG